VRRPDDAVTTRQHCEKEYREKYEAQCSKDDRTPRRPEIEEYVFYDAHT
jgi:hypothetical protein